MQKERADDALNVAGFVQCLLTPKRLRIDFMSINQEQPTFRTYIDV